MPNHTHAKTEINDRGEAIETGRYLSLPPSETKIKLLSELMDAYKTTSAKKIHLAELDGSRPVTA